jgi:hypothetical protein
LRVPIVVGLHLLPAAAAAVAIVALGLAQGGFAQGGWMLETVAFAAIGMAALVSHGSTRPAGGALLTLAGLAALTAWTAMSAAWAPDDALALVDARRGVLYLAVLVAFVFVARLHPQALANATFAGIAVLMTIAVLVYLLPLDGHTADPFEGYLLSEPIGYANAVGIVAAVGLVLALLPMPRARRPTGAAAAMCAAALTLSGSRGAVLAALVGLAATFALAPDRRAITRSLLALAPGAMVAIALCSVVDVRGPYPSFDEARSDLLAVGLVCAALLGAFVAPWIDARLEARPRILRPATLSLATLAALSAAALVTRAEAFTDSRLAYWRVAADMARDHPLLGAGSGSFASYWQASGADRGAQDAHGAFAEAAAELGIPGLILIGLVLLVPLGAGLRARTTRWVAVVAGAYCAAVVHTALDWDRELPVVVVVASALAASLLAARPRSG